MIEIRSRQLSDANLTEYKNNNLSYNKLREAEGTHGIIPIRHEKARRSRSVLLSWFNDVTSSAARKGIVERGIVFLVDVSAVADWLVDDHLSRRDASKSYLLSFSLSLAMSRAKFFCSCRNWNFPQFFEAGNLNTEL